MPDQKVPSQQAMDDLQSKVAFQEQVIQQLDDALASQQQQLMALSHRLDLMMNEIKVMEKAAPEAPEPPPPHY